MMRDIVVDTNVMLHAENSEIQYHQSSRTLIEMILDSDFHICLDEGFDLDEARNRSQIGHEYLKHLRFGSLGLALIVSKGARGHIKLLPKSVPRHVSRLINRSVGSSYDRVYVKVTYNSDGKVLASHDFNDIPQDCRDNLLYSAGIFVGCAEECLMRF